jgi:uncharacterized BrkB/YihY/UPF0761 family membrane protein
VTEVFAAIGVFVVALPVMIGLGILAVMWRAWWLYPAWAWFLVPLGLPGIRFWHFTALLVLVSALIYRVDTKKDERKTDWGVIIVGFLWPILSWAILRWMRQ